MSLHLSSLCLCLEFLGGSILDYPACQVIVTRTRYWTPFPALCPRSWSSFPTPVFHIYKHIKSTIASLSLNMLQWCSNQIRKNKRNVYLKSKEFEIFLRRKSPAYTSFFLLQKRENNNVCGSFFGDQFPIITCEVIGIFVSDMGRFCHGIYRSARN